MIRYIGDFKAAAALTVMGQHPVERIQRQIVLGQVLHRLLFPVSVRIGSNQFDVLIKLQGTEDAAPVESIYGLVKLNVSLNGKGCGFRLGVIQEYCAILFFRFRLTFRRVCLRRVLLHLRGNHHKFVPLLQPKGNRLRCRQPELQRQFPGSRPGSREGNGQFHAMLRFLQRC